MFNSYPSLTRYDLRYSRFHKNRTLFFRRENTTYVLTEWPELASFRSAEGSEDHWVPDFMAGNYTFDACQDIFMRRQSEYVKYILPQMSHADICIEYSPSQPMVESFTIETEDPCIQCKLVCRSTILPYIHSYVENFSKKIDIQLDSSNTYTVVDSSEITVDILMKRLPQQYLRYVELETMMSGYLGLFQMLVLLILINPA